MQLKVYTASRLKEGPRWRAMMNDWPEVEFVARWPFVHITPEGESGWPQDSPAHGSIFWQHDHEDIIRADVVLVYGHPDDVLRGALVEAGIGIALGKIVVVVGENESYGTWQYHQGVKRVATFEDARSLLRLMATPGTKEEWP